MRSASTYRAARRDEARRRAVVHGGRMLDQWVSLRERGDRTSGHLEFAPLRSAGYPVRANRSTRFPRTPMSIYSARQSGLYR